MVKIGKFTGKEYPSEEKNIPECCMNIDEHSKLYVEVKAWKFPMECCSDCRGCPAYQHS